MEIKLQQSIDEKYYSSNSNYNIASFSLVHTLPLVSVGITTFRRPRTLKQTLNSVISQTYKNLEIIISNDDMNDIKTKNIIKQFLKTDSRIKYISNKIKLGSTLNQLSVLKHSCGKYFMWLNDDDWIDKNYIEDCLFTITSNPDLILVCGKTRFYQDNIFAYNGRAINILSKDSRKRLLTFYTQQLGSGNSPNFGIILKEELEKISVKNILGWDNILFSNIAYKGKIKTLDTIYIHRRLNGESKSLRDIALELNRNPLERVFPHLFLWRNIFMDICFNSRIFKSTSTFSRFFIGIKLTLILLFNLPKYYSIYKMRKGTIKRNYHLEKIATSVYLSEVKVQ